MQNCTIFRYVRCTRRAFVQGYRKFRRWNLFNNSRLLQKTRKVTSRKLRKKMCRKTFSRKPTQNQRSHWYLEVSNHCEFDLFINFTIRLDYPIFIVFYHFDSLFIRVISYNFAFLSKFMLVWRGSLYERRRKELKFALWYGISLPSWNVVYRS